MNIIGFGLYKSSIGGEFNVSNNETLSMCCGVFPVIDMNGVTGVNTIENNLPSCNSEQALVWMKCQIAPILL